MKFLLYLFAFTFAIFLNAQITRYPYIQSTTTNSTIIAWKTSNSSLGIVKYGIDSTNLIFTQSEASATFNHAVLLENLQEDTKYYYEIYSGLTLETAEYFYTAKDSTHNSFSFIQYGDCGFNTTVQYEIGALMEADSAEFAVVCGDVDQGGLPHFSPSGGGDNYDDIYFDVYNDGTNTKMLSRECHYTAIGNHDYYANNGAEYDNSFYLPHNNNENSERYYSFTWGDAKFICLDVITPYDNSGLAPPFYNTAPISDRWWTDFRVGSPQYQFLEDELRCNDKKWVFVYFHEGPWTNYWGADYNILPSFGGDYYQWDGNVMVRDNLVPIFEQYNVDFVLCGHSHLYERGEWNGVTYVTSGAAGDSGTPNGTEYVNPHWAQLPLSILENSYAKYKVFDDSIYLQCINKDNNVIDTYSKTKIYTPFAVNPTITNTTCYQGNDGTVSLNVVGPKPPYTIEWFNGDTTFVRDSLSAGTYYAYVRNVYDCEKVISVTIEEPPVIIPQIVSNNGTDLFCEGDSISLSSNNLYSSYLWSNGDTTNQIYVKTPQALTLNIVTNNGCIGTSSSFSVDYLPEPIAFFSQANSGFTYNFLAVNTNVTSYTWSFDDGTDTTLTNTLVTHTFATDGNYDVALYASNECKTDTFILDVKVGKGDSIIDTTGIFNLRNYETLLVQPNPFSDKTQIVTSNLEGTLKVSIYNLKGEKLRQFKTKDTTFILERKKLTKGYYYVKIVGNKKQAISKILVN